MSYLRKIYYRLSPQNRLRVRRLLYLPGDLLRKKDDPKIPPRGMIFTGAGDFVAEGQRQLDYLKRYTDLRPDMDVLDVGSGIGRTAFALTSYLDEKGTYSGFDAMPQGVEWCQSRYADLDNFRFEYIEIYNNLYNKDGQSSTEIDFPYGDDSFDLAFLFSVFSHMLAEEIAHYLYELHRVLRPGGQVLATFFTYDEDVLSRMKKGETDMQFSVDKGHYWLMDEKVSHANVAFEKNYLEYMIHDAGFVIERQIAGYWSDFSRQAQEYDYQDIWVLRKT